MARRRTFTPEFKARVVLEELTGVKDKAEICREYRLRPQVFSRWREECLQRAPAIVAGDRSEEQARIAERERMVGRLTMELEVAKKASSLLASPLNGKGRGSRGWRRRTRSPGLVRCVEWPAAATTPGRLRRPMKPGSKRRSGKRRRDGPPTGIGALPTSCGARDGRSTPSACGV